METELFEKKTKDGEMKQLSAAKPIIVDWDEKYRQGTPIWDVGAVHSELPKVFEEYKFPKGGTLLEIGCGTGADAIYLAKKRFEVTAVDCSPIALERARLRGEQQNALLRFVLDDIFDFVRTASQFDIVYDAGFYHYIRNVKLEQYLDILWRLTKPGSWFFCLAGNVSESAEDSPPQVSEDDIRFELGRLFEFIHLRPARFETNQRPQGFIGWSCLMRRPEVKI
jgi:SAM-dependent methyltransferase